MPDHADSGSDSLSGSESNAAKALNGNVAPKVLKTPKLTLFRTNLAVVPFMVKQRFWMCCYVSLEANFEG